MKLTLLTIQLCFIASNSYHISTNIFSSISQRSSHLYMSEVVDQGEVSKLIKDGRYNDACELLKRNPMIQLNQYDGCQLLNHINELAPSELRDGESIEKALTDSSTFLYRRLERQKIIQGFNCIDGNYPERSIDITPVKLEEKTGMKSESLSPKQRTTYWQLAGIGLCLAEFWFGDTIGVDPVFTLIPGTMFLFGVDQIAFKGAYFETLYRKLVPEYRRKVIVHEAGHLMIAYLLGQSVRGVITSAWEARKFPEIRGSAGTIFYDSKLADELSRQTLTRSTIDRMCIEFMAGIAAEAIEFQVCEGGIADEQSLVSFLTSLSPPWNLLRIQGQARWAVLQAILLLKEHKESFNAVVELLDAGNTNIGDIVFAIEKNLPAQLPSQLRKLEREQKQKTQENDFLLRYVQNKIWRVGGIEPATSPVYADRDQPAASVESYVENNAKNAAVPAVHQKQVSVKEVIEEEDTVTEFANKMRLLEEAVSRGDLDLQQQKQGGLWLNGLQTLQSSPLTQPRNETAAAVEKKPSEKATKFEDAVRIIDPNQSPDTFPIPPALDNFEQRIKDFAIEEGVFFGVPLDDDGNSNIDEVTTATDKAEEERPLQDWDVLKMLRTNRGFQLKELEIEENMQIQMLAEATKTLASLQQERTSK